jgi:SagB-type dehydrogenase family enzyme
VQQERICNHHTELAERYWQGTFFDSAAMLARGVGKEGAPDEPLKFKAYRGQPRHPLPQSAPSSLGGLAAALAADHGGEPLDDARLGTLLYYGYGFSRIDVGAVGGWPYHRLVPSARCFYPTELYVIRSGTAYHYDQLHHGLVELRTGVDREVLDRALGASTEGSEAVLVLTSHYWKTAFRYRDYAYRLCSQENGMVAGNLLLVAGALGLGGRVHYQFLDAAVDRLLGLQTGRERTVAVLPLRRDPAAGTAPRPATAAELVELLPEARPQFLEVVESPHLAPDTYEMDAGSVLESTADFGPPLSAADPADRGTVVDLGAGPAVDLAAALRARHSGGTLFRALADDLPAAVLAGIARHARAPYASDIGDGPFCDVRVMVRHVEGVAPGIYRCDRDGTLRRLSDGLPESLAEEAWLAFGPPIADFRAIGMQVYLVADRRLASQRLGNRGYRILSQDAGLVAQRVCVLAGGVGLAARPANGYAVPVLQRLLGIDDPDLVPLFQIAVGRRSVSAQYEMPVGF